MQQYTYVLDETLTGDQMAQQIAALPIYQTATAKLMVVLSPNCDLDFLHEELRKQARDLPDVISVGMTTMGNSSESMHVQEHPVVTMLFFEGGHPEVNVYDCHQMKPFQASLAFSKVLDAAPNAKAVFCTSSDITIALGDFISGVASLHPDVPLFGALAGTRVVTQDQSLFFVGQNIYDRGILTVTFCGEDLHAKPVYNLGWRPIGNEHIITACDGPGLVSTIDDEPAVSLYRRYLGITPDDAYFNNVCSFPLVMRSGKHLTARVPIDFAPGGGLKFPADIERGAHVRFAYSHPDQLMRETRYSANEMAEFEPQALLLFSCLNRRVFLGNERAEEEVTYYRNACPTMAWGYGYGEIFHSVDGGGHLNSTIVAMGLREGPASGNPPQLLEETRPRGSKDVIPLSERLATFLEATTNELNETIAELETVAKRDPLTGAFNRRRMDEVMHYELSKRRKEDYLVLLMYDIDHFKDVNDTFGHDTGDVVLKDLTRCVQACIRNGDTLGRWGGEEFLCLLTGVSLDQALVVAERIRHRVEHTKFLRVDRITISIGVTAARPNDTPDTFFQRVDKAMYDAKHAGRNCVRVR